METGGNEKLVHSRTTAFVISHQSAVGNVTSVRLRLAVADGLCTPDESSHLQVEAELKGTIRTSEANKGSQYEHLTPLPCYNNTHWIFTGFKLLYCLIIYLSTCSNRLVWGLEALLGFADGCQLMLTVKASQETKAYSATVLDICFSWLSMSSVFYFPCL